MVNRVEMDVPEKLTDWLLRNDLTVHVELRDAAPRRVIHLSDVLTQLIRPPLEEPQHLVV